jgi:ribosomal protein S18 acetylase RimI-like enzyme
MQIRGLTPDDYAPLIAVVDAWWGGRAMVAMLPKLFFVHFHQTSFVVVERDERIGFLIGFLSPALPEEAYIHFVGVHPEYRGRGVGKELYERFFQLARQANRYRVRCVTSPVNSTSIAFHRAIGFAIEGTADGASGIPIHYGYDGPGEDRVLLVKDLYWRPNRR